MRTVKLTVFCEIMQVCVGRCKLFVLLTGLMLPVNRKMNSAHMIECKCF